jgi:PAS domain S-box-containing protein
MSPVSIPLAAIALLLVVLATFVLRAHRSCAVNRWFAAFVFSVALWSLGVAGVNSYWDKLDIWPQLTFAAASLIPAFFFGFIHAYPRASKGPARIMLRAVLAAGISLAVLSATTTLIVFDHRLGPEGPHRESGPLYPLFAMYFLLASAGGVGTLVVKRHHAVGIERLQLHHLMIGVFASGAGAVTSNLVLPIATGKSTHSWIGPFFMLALILFVAHAIIRHRLMDLRLVVHRGLTLAIAAVLSFIPVVMLLVFIWPRLVAHLRPSEVLGLLAAIAVVTLLVPITRDVAGRLLDRYVYRRRANYRRTVLEASRALTRVLDLRILLPFVRDTVLQSTEAEGVAIYVRDERRFTQLVPEARHPGGRFEAPAVLPDTIVARLDASPDALVADELGRAPSSEGERRLQHDLVASNWALVLPAVFEDAVIGAIVLGPKRSGDPYFPEDLDLLMTLANQAGIAIKNARLYFQVVLANEHLQNIVATINSGVAAVDATGEITMFNPAAEQLTGLAGNAARGRHASVLPAPLGSTLVETLGDGVARTYPDADLSDGTTSRPVMCTTSPLREPFGSILGAVAVFSDLTPVKELEVERRRAERLALLEAIAAGIAHEVKNPLVAIKTFVQLIPRRRNDARFLDDFSRVVGHEIDRMERLVARLRSLSRPGQRPLQPLDVRQPIVQAVEFMQPSFEEKGIRLQTELGETGFLVAGDAGELEALFLNLLINAHQATPPNGNVVMRLGRQDGHVTVEVVDSGPGIPAEVLDRVFDPFFTTKPRGSGLGLAICAGIAGTHRARIRAGNAPDGGARFVVEFPLAVSAPASAA